MERKTNILVMESGGDLPSPSARLGVLDVLAPLEQRGICTVQYKKTVDIRAHDVEWCDILVDVRGRDQAQLSVVKAARASGRYILYFLDDDLLNIPREIAKGVTDLPKVKESLIASVNLASKLWVVNSRLGEKYSGYCPGGWICSRVPMLTLPAHSTALQQAQAFVRIVYAGSPDHSAVLRRYLANPIRWLCMEFGAALQVTFMGADLGLIDMPNYHFYPHSEDYSVYKKRMSESGFQIGIAVVEDQEFYHHKYYNKFLEYTSVGIVGVYTQAEPYTLVIEHEKNGLLCKNGQTEWYIALKRLIQDTELRNSCLENAMQMLTDDFNPEAVADGILKEFPELETYRAKSISKITFKLRNTKFWHYISQAELLWDEYKLIAIPVIFYKGVRKLLRRFGGHCLIKASQPK